MRVFMRGERGIAGVLLATLLGLASIATPGYPFVHDFPGQPQMRDLREQNQAAVTKVKVGMTKAEVLAMFRTGNIKCFAGYEETSLRNPCKEERVSAGGRNVEVLYFYTDLKKMDSKITEEETTPVMFEKDKVIGVGWKEKQDLLK